MHPEPIPSANSTAVKLNDNEKKEEDIKKEDKKLDESNEWPLK